MNNIEQILELFKKNNYIVYEDPYKVNILLIRSSKVITNKFDDVIIWFWKDDKGEWQIKTAKCTTKPGIYYIKNPLSTLGTAILKTGQYENSHKLGLHKGIYEALVQQKSLPVWRDDDKDEWIDEKTTQVGIFGINIHRANPKLESTLVDKYSAACQVFANPFSYKSFINQCVIHKNKYSNNFTITLIDKF